MNIYFVIAKSHAKISEIYVKNWRQIKITEYSVLEVIKTSMCILEFSCDKMSYQFKHKICKILTIFL